MAIDLLHFQSLRANFIYCFGQFGGFVVYFFHSVRVKKYGEFTNYPYSILSLQRSSVYDSHFVPRLDHGSLLSSDSRRLAPTETHIYLLIPKCSDFLKPNKRTYEEF